MDVEERTKELYEEVTRFLVTGQRPGRRELRAICRKLAELEQRVEEQCRRIDPE